MRNFPKNNPTKKSTKIHKLKPTTIIYPITKAKDKNVYGKSKPVNLYAVDVITPNKKITINFKIKLLTIKENTIPKTKNNKRNNSKPIGKTMLFLFNL